MTMANDDEFGTGTGLFTDYSATITDAWFTLNPTTGATQIHFENKLDEGFERSIKDGEVSNYAEEMFSCGRDWEIADLVEIIDAKGNPRRKVHPNSRYGKLINQAILFNANQDMAKSCADRGIKFSAKDARVWIGTRWEWAEFSEPWDNKDTGKSGIATYNFPKSYLGTIEVSTRSQWRQGLSGELVTAMEKIAKGSPDLDSFVNGCVELPEIASNGKLLAAIQDEMVYNELKGQ